MGEYFTLFIGAVLINNFVLTKFLGLCIFFGVSKNLNASIGMGFAVTSVITLSTMLAWLVYNFVLVPLDLTFLRTITFVVLIASFVQLLEIIIKKNRLRCIICGGSTSCSLRRTVSFCPSPY